MQYAVLPVPHNVEIVLWPHYVQAQRKTSTTAQLLTSDDDAFHVRSEQSVTRGRLFLCTHLQK